jgi:hypothetical protein
LGCDDQDQPAPLYLVDADALTVREMVMRMRHTSALSSSITPSLAARPIGIPLSAFGWRPVLRGIGKPKMLYLPRRHEAITCLIATRARHRSRPQR